MLEFKVPTLPPSINRLYSINYNHRCIYLSQEGRSYKQLVKQYMPVYNHSIDSYYGMEIDIYSNFKYKNGKNRKLDIQNLAKVLIDAIFERIGQDDSYLTTLTIKKMQYIDTPYTYIRLWEIQGGE